MSTVGTIKSATEFKTQTLGVASYEVTELTKVSGSELSDIILTRDLYETLVKYFGEISKLDTQNFEERVEILPKNVEKDFNTKSKIKRKVSDT